MTNNEEWVRLPGQPAYDHAGHQIGEVRRVFFDESSNEPAWVTVAARRFGEQEAVVPLNGSRISPSGLALGVRSDLVKDAPTIDPGSDISMQQAIQVSRHYGGSYESAASDRASDKTELTSFEERIEVGKEVIDSGTARLHKSVVTEPVEATVPLHHEQLRVERTPAKGSGDSHQFTDEDAQISLHDERATISKKTVPVETVRMSIEGSDREERLRDQVRRERIELDDRTIHREDEPAPARRR